MCMTIILINYVQNSHVKKITIKQCVKTQKADISWQNNECVIIIKKYVIKIILNSPEHHTKTKNSCTKF